MKLVRFISVDDRVLVGSVNSPGSETATVIEGNIYSDFIVTSQTIKIKQLLSPLIPSIIMGIGLNYKKYANITGRKFPTIPVMFIKALGTVIGCGESIKLPRAGPDQVDFEGELAVVIGITAKNVLVDDAME